MLEAENTGRQHCAQIVKIQQEMRARLQDQFEQYSLLKDGERFPLAELEKGSVFVPDGYPHGTLIRVISENLNLRHLELGFDRYSTVEQFGFVVDTAGITEDEKNAVLYVHQGLVYGGSSRNIEVGQVRHWRQQDDPTEYDRRADILFRVNKVEIVSMGSGIRRRLNNALSVTGHLPVLAPQQA